MKGLEEILKNRRKNISKRNGFSKAFGILKGKIKGSSVNYVLKLRKEWRIKKLLIQL